MMKKETHKYLYTDRQNDLVHLLAQSLLQQQSLQQLCTNQLAQFQTFQHFYTDTGNQHQNNSTFKV